MLHCDASGKILPPNQLAIGGEISVLNGPCANFIATVKNIDATHCILVLIDFVGQGACCRYSYSS